jgi:glycosyltransferase involved in cell wall biosynthesis
MRLHIFYDKNNIIRLASPEKLVSNKYTRVELETSENPTDLVGKTIKLGNPGYNGNNKKVKLALIANWGDDCGISTYTKFLVDALIPKLDGLKIFSERRNQVNDVNNDIYHVEYTWKRGQSMLDTINKVISWNPSIVMIQHEFGLFPQANYFLPMIERLDDAKIPLISTLHSVYEHKDKSVCTSVLKNVIVHSDNAQKCLKDTLKHTNQRSWVIPHGCIDLGNNVAQNWNYFGVPYPIMQFGFGFNYKGVDIALEAVAKLKAGDPKFKDIFYCYLCSESNHAQNTHNNYYKLLRNKVEELRLNDNVTIQRGFFSEEELNQHLRTARLAIFPYVTDPDNVVFGASGASRIAMANNVPTIASASHMFDDIEGVLPRPFGVTELAQEIDKIFSNDQYRNNLLKRQRDYIKNNSWEITAQRYYNVLKDLVDTANKNVIIV